MKQFLIRFANFLTGQILYGIGIVTSIRANIGYAPWEVFHAGIAKTVGSTIGIVSIFAGIIILITVTVAGEKIGFGTVLSMVLMGLLIDGLMYLNIIPLAKNYLVGVIMLIAGLFIISLGSYFYIKSAFGVGPRDNLMVVIRRKTRLPVGVCRVAVELIVTLIGWALGGMVGLGTIISVIAIGFCIQITFRVFRFDPTTVKHDTFAATIRFLARKEKYQDEDNDA